jgi:hypothetical protein
MSELDDDANRCVQHAAHERACGAAGGYAREVGQRRIRCVQLRLRWIRGHGGSDQACTTGMHRLHRLLPHPRDPISNSHDHTLFILSFHTNTCSICSTSTRPPKPNAQTSLPGNSPTTAIRSPPSLSHSIPPEGFLMQPSSTPTCFTMWSRRTLQGSRMWKAERPRRCTSSG